MNQELISKKKDLVEYFLKYGYLISDELLDSLDAQADYDSIKEILNKINSTDILIVSNDIANLITKLPKGINWLDFEQSKAFYEKGKDNAYHRFLEFIAKNYEQTLDDMYVVRILSAQSSELKKWTPDDFVQHLNVRFNSIEKLLRRRQELINLLSINRLVNKHERENVSFIGMVQKIDFTKNQNLVLTLEDRTGSINVIVNKNKPQLFDEASKIVNDEVIAIQGVTSKGIVFANNIIWPDLPNKELKKCKDECYAIFLSDLHIGSKYFMEEEFLRFIKWLNLEVGDEGQRRIAEKVRYLFIVGDIVDGCGVYPNQEDDLLIKDVKLQYDQCAKFLDMIPKSIKILMCAGNHDAMRLTEPQLPIYKEFAEEIYRLPNLIMVSNPTLVNIHSNENFSGFDILLYHGFSFDYYVANVDFIRVNGGYDRIDNVMRFLLQRRHLAPTHSSNSYAPDTKFDPLVIDTLPDIFATGHIHKALAANYKGITLISSGCWQSMTEYQKRHGHKPDPCRVPIVNLQTRDVRILRFGK